MDSDLSIRETILGVIKSRDLNNEGVIHTSDFRSAVADLGFAFGDPLIENILVHCVVNSDGFVDFNGLERELARERRVLNAKISAIPEQRTVKTSSGVPLKPWRADVVHHQKMQSERQAKLLQEKHNDVFEAFRKYEEQQHSEDELISCIKSLGVVPTRSFLELLRTNRSCEISFGDFMRSLIHYDPNSKPLDHNQPAGGSASLMGRNDGKDREEHQAGLFYARKRMDFQKKNAMQSSVMTSNKTGKRLNLPHEGDGHFPGGTKSRSAAGAQSSTKAAHFKTSSTGVKDILSDYESSGTLLLSSAHMSMHKGMKGELPAGREELSYTSEQKLLREQVLAALRKLDAGEISVVEFLDIIFHMGIELPEGVLKQLKLQQQSGLLDWRACVHELDGYVFKHRSLEDNSPHEMVTAAMQKLVAALSGEGPLDSLSQLLAFFHRVDENGDKQLSFNEFRKACRDFLQEQSNRAGREGLRLSDSDLRYLFNHFDKSGDGYLSYEEVVSSLQGDVSPRRKDIIRQAFVRMDGSGAGEITLETFLDNFSVAQYPDVAAGRKTPWKALRDIEDFFQLCSTRGSDMSSVITARDFEYFFSNISPCFESDESFFDAVRAMTGLSSQKPSVQIQRMRTGDTKRVPLAKQSFGDVIAWGQEASYLESTTVSTNRQKKTVVPNFSKQPDVISWTERKGEKYDPPDAIDGINLSRTNKGRGTTNLLAWQNPPRRQPKNDYDEVVRNRDTGPESEDMFLMKGYQWSEGKKSQYGGQCPYGVDEDLSSQSASTRNSVQQQGKVNSPKPRSLADIMASRNA